MAKEQLGGRQRLGLKEDRTAETPQLSSLCAITIVQGLPQKKVISQCWELTSLRTHNQAACRLAADRSGVERPRYHENNLYSVTSGMFGWNYTAYQCEFGTKVNFQAQRL